MASEETIHLEPYDAAWPSRFERERDALRRTLEAWLAGPIEHIGSTAVPGLVAKPVIDIMEGVRTLEHARPAIAALQALSYQYWPYRSDVMHWFCKPDTSHRTHHLHLVPQGSRLWIERLAFRDYLRAHPRTAGEYAALKTSLAARFASDREAYTDAKGPFVAAVVRAAFEHQEEH
jgi:GrpB-like predicted nucleotidyltransferase (UPF0157 family)